MRSVSSLVLAALVAVAAVRAPAQQATAGVAVRLSLDDALRIAQAQNPAIGVARAGVTRATGQHMQARSQYLPQLNATAGYTKTLQSQFQGFAASASDTSTTPKSDNGGGGFDLSKTSFGASNQWALGLSFSQNVYTGGRIPAQNDAANAQLRSANIELAAQRAQLSLDVTSAYYDAVLADQLVAIADSSLAQTGAILAQTRVARQVGNASEFELLRAQVTRDNQLPGQIRARANRQTAYLHVKQLLNMQLDDSLQLTTRIEDPAGPTMPSIAMNVAPDTTSSDRATVRQLDEAIRAQEAQVKIARSERIPSLAIVSNYQRLYFPAQAFPNLSSGVNNWTLGLSTNFPLLDGGRIKGDEVVAQAGLEQAKAQREQARQFAALDARVALTALNEAQATWDASRGTAEQAARAYSIDEVRLNEGISTQTDLTQSRLLLEQARANRALAARNLAVARVRLALLRDLPLQAAGAGVTNAASGGAAAAQQQQPQRSPTSTQTGGSPTGNPFGSSQP